MKFSQNGTTIIESIIVMVIIVTWVVGMYNIFINSQNVAESTSNRVQAISMAREWIEAMSNIRDTNWLLFSANRQNCWMTLNYNANCITANWTVSFPFTHINSWSYIIYKNSENDRWYLSWANTWNYSQEEYRNIFRINLDDLGFYTQSGGTNFLPIFTREIKISFLDNETPPQKIKVESIIKWSDSARKSWNYEVSLDTTLTNWKK